MCSDGKHDMFEPLPWVYEDYVKGCQEAWNVTPRPDWPITQYWGKNISVASNIVFR